MIFLRFGILLCLQSANLIAQKQEERFRDSSSSENSDLSCKGLLEQLDKILNTFLHWRFPIARAVFVLRIFILGAIDFCISINFNSRTQFVSNFP